MKTTIALISILLLMASCTDTPSPEAAGELSTVQGFIRWEDQPRAPQKPEGFNYKGHWLFHVDTETQVFTWKVNGHSGYNLEGTLEDEIGRRALHLFDGHTRELVAPADWYTPAVGSMNTRQEILICYNRLVGKTSQLTQGMLPDPTQGVHALCRFRTAKGWQPEFRAGSLDRIASWIKDVTALPNGDFRLTYIADDGWLMDPTDKHFVMEQRIQDGVLIASKMAKPLFDKVR